MRRGRGLVRVHWFRQMLGLNVQLCSQSGGDGQKAHSRSHCDVQPVTPQNRSGSFDPKRLFLFLTARHLFLRKAAQRPASSASPARVAVDGLYDTIFNMLMLRSSHTTGVAVAAAGACPAVKVKGCRALPNLVTMLEEERSPRFSPGKKNHKCKIAETSFWPRNSSSFAAERVRA